ncbi:MAG: alpha/beta hydrolase [Gammaproteobacteria bacterium]
MDQTPPPIEIVTTAPPRASIIWLHGLGADGHDFVPLVPALALPPAMAIRFIFPHAPRRAVTINGGMVMRAWYDIYDAGFTRREDEAGIHDAAQRVDALIRREIERGIPPQRIVLAGFSQGGAIALHCGLRHPQPLAGIMALSSYLPLAARLAEEQHSANRQTPILMIHGSRDAIVPPPLAHASKRILEQLDHPLEWHEFLMGHEVSLEEIAVIGAWLQRHLGDPPETAENNQ